MINICDECGQYFCPSACPNFSGFLSGVGYPRKACSLCEGGIYRGESYYLSGKKILCADCADELISPELLELLGCSSTEEFFEMLCIPRCEA